MTLIELKDNQNIKRDIKLSKLYAQFGELLCELKKKELSQSIIQLINAAVAEINTSMLTGNELKKIG